MPDFDAFFKQATSTPPFPFQRDFAERDELPALVDIPTGLGKTAMAVVGWLWRRFGAGREVRGQTPRRLVYCLPMRVLVEQTRDNAIVWLDHLDLRAARGDGGKMLAPHGSCVQRKPPSEDESERGPRGQLQSGSYEPPTLELWTNSFSDRRVAVYVLMGGEDEDDWDIHPEREAIIIGTQDMLLSRALNRGYAASRARWPMRFGLLHTDCLWVFDEIQLMGSGLATTAQLEAFRRLLPSNESPQAKDGHGCRSVWMSATMQRDWLNTVDFKDRVDGLACLELREDDRKQGEVEKRWNAKKPLSRAENSVNPKGPKSLAEEIVKKHGEAKGRTIVVVNTVKRACDLLAEIKKEWTAATDENLILIHSRFRPPDRKAQIEKMKPDAPPEQLPADGMIVVSTQVIEAGVDVSATTLFTELGPWASLVQRFGRCNRRGEQNQHACVRWIDVPDKDAAPYNAEDLTKARETLRAIGEKPEVQRSVSLAALSELDVELRFEHTHVIRKRDLIDLFDTTPDLAGNDIDIDRFVREVEDSDVRVFWRALDRSNGHGPPPTDQPAPRREELCPAPIGSDKNPGVRQFAKQHKGNFWRWSFLDETWEKVDAAKITPGQVFLVHADAGGYSKERGWTGNPGDKPTLEYAPKAEQACNPDGNESDANSQISVWQMLTQHTDEVSRELECILAALEPGEVEALRLAARWHDLGKAHEVFRTALPDGIPDATKLWAKAAGQWKRYGRRHFRHELASALAVLQRPHDTLKTLSDDALNLVAYLVAAHHGKARLSIRSLPNETLPEGNLRFARGVWDDDPLPATDLGGGITAQAVTLSLELMELGLCEQPPFAGQPSWAERMIRLRDRLGPFRLAYLEAILRAADMRASKAAEQRAPTGQPVGGGGDAKEADHG